MDANRPCPDSALLAAFIDGTLVDDDRSAVVAHLTDCGACRCTADNVMAFKEVLERERSWESTASPANAIKITRARPRRRWTREQTRVVAWTLAAAATLAVVLYPQPPSTRESAASPLTELVNASAGPRPITARVSDGSRYGPAPTLRATPADERGRWRLASAAGRIREAYEDDPLSSAQHAVGVAALLVGRFDDAVASLSRAAAAAPSDHRILNDLAAAYYERAVIAGHADDLPRALSIVERVLALSPDSSDAWFNRALIITALGLRTQAREAWSAYLEKDTTSPWAAEARARRIAFSASPGANDWPELRQKLETTDDKAIVDEAVRRFASGVREYLDRDLFGAWASNIERGESASRSLQRARMIADAFVRLAGDDTYADALTVIDRVHERNGGTLLVLARAHREYGAGLQLLAKGAVTEAAASLRRAEPVLSASGSPLALRVQLEIAGTEYYAGRFDSALQPLTRVKAAALAGDYVNLVARAEWLSGLIGFARNDYGAAQIGYEEMFEAASASGDTEQVAFARGLLANLHERLGDLTSAWRHRISAATMLDDISTPQVVANLLLSAAGDAATHGNHHAALVFQSSLLGSRLPINPITEIQTLAQRSRTLNQLGRHAEALQTLRMARDRVSHISDRGSQDRIEPDLLAADAEVFRRSDPVRAIAAAERALSLPVVQRDPLRVARFSLSLAEAMLDSNALDQADTAVQRGIAALAPLRDQPSADTRIGTSDPLWALFVKGLELASRRGDAGRAFELSEQRRLQTSIEHRRWGGHVISLAEFQRKLPADTAAAVLNQVDDQLHIWIVRPWGVRTHIVSITPARAASLIGAHLYEVAVGSPSPQVSGHLFDRLVKPVVAALTDVRNLVVIADAPYQRVAFPGLWDHRRNRFLLEDVAVVASPSATAYVGALARAEEMSVGGVRQAVVIESPMGEAEREPDPRNQLNDREVATLYPDAEVRRGEAATAKRLMNHRRVRDVIHVSAPLHPNDEFPFLSRLLLADMPGRKYSGAIFARHVGDTELSHARLVTLEPRDERSATTHGPGAFGFSRALLAAGVPNVVGPIAAVRAQTLERSWLAFHRHYAAGLSAAESLRQAQLTALSDSNHRLGPWAMLTVFGSTQ